MQARVSNAGQPDARRSVLLAQYNSSRSIASALAHCPWPDAFRAGTVLVRSLFEHAVDFVIVLDDASGELARRFIAFDEVQLWNVQKNKQRGRAERGLPRDKETEEHLHDEDNKNRVKAALREYWPEIPWGAEQKLGKLDWDGRDLKERATVAGEHHGKLLYEEKWGLWSMMIHGRLPAMSPLLRAYHSAEALYYAFQCLKEMTRMLAVEYDCDDAEITAGEEIEVRWMMRTGTDAEPE